MLITIVSRLVELTNLLCSIVHIRLVALVVASMILRTAVMAIRKRQREKIKKERCIITLTRIFAGSVLDSVWDFPSQTDMVLLTMTEAIIVVYVFGFYSQGLIPYVHNSSLTWNAI